MILVSFRQWPITGVVFAIPKYQLDYLTLEMEQTTELNIFQSFTGPPEWFTGDYIEKALQEAERDPSLKLLSHSVVSATKPGDNFASIALRLKATYKGKGKEETKSFIVKVEPFKEGIQKDMLTATLLFDTEISMYTQVIPEMQRLIKEIDPEEVLAPRLSFSSLKPHKIVFIDDLSPEFTMSDKPLDFLASAKVFENIAKFHALSFFAHDNKSLSFDQYKDGFVSETMRQMVGYINHEFTSFAKAIQGWDGMEEIAQRYFTLIPTLFDKVLELFAVNKNGYNVLNHGDFHIKNILFREEEEDKIEDIRLIDFQLCIWASPAIDLFFALYCIVNHEARERRDELIRIYHNQFTKTLQEMGFLNRIPSLLDLQVELLRNGLIEVFVTAFLVPILYKDKEQAEKLASGADDVGDSAAQMKMTLDTPELKAALLKVLPGFLQKGFLE